VSFVQPSSEQSADFSSIYDDISLGGRQVKARLDCLKFGGLLNLNLSPTQKIELQA
jgi:hypothetical protein